MAESRAPVFGPVCPGKTVSERGREVTPPKGITRPFGAVKENVRGSIEQKFYRC